MKKTGLLALLLAAGSLLSGCAVTPCCTGARDAQASFPTQTQKVLAVGYGSMGGFQSHLTLGQQKLMAMRAARVDAYRNLAEQVYGFRVWGNTAVSSFATQNDNVRTYVDGFIRGARLVNMTAIADGNFEATVELDLTPSFFSCISNTTITSSCNVPVVSAPDGYCSASGCVQPSAYYYTTQ